MKYVKLICRRVIYGSGMFGIEIGSHIISSCDQWHKLDFIFNAQAEEVYQNWRLKMAADEHLQFSDQDLPKTL